MSTHQRKLKTVLAWTSVFIVFTPLAAYGFFNFIDSPVSRAMDLFASPSLVRFFSAARVTLDRDTSFIIVLSITIYALLKKSKRLAFFSLVLFILLGWAGEGLKNVIKRERPYSPYYAKQIKAEPTKSFAYPSGHSLRASYLFFTAAMIVKRSRLSRNAKTALKLICYSAIILVSFSSVYLRAHWFSDVVGACILGYVFYTMLLAISSEDNTVFK